MRWPWQKKNDCDEAERAKREAEKHLAEIEAQWPEVHRVTSSLRGHRDHFGEAIEWIMRGGRA